MIRGSSKLFYTKTVQHFCGLNSLTHSKSNLERKQKWCPDTSVLYVILAPRTSRTLLPSLYISIDKTTTLFMTFFSLAVNVVFPLPDAPAVQVMSVLGSVTCARAYVSKVIIYIDIASLHRIQKGSESTSDTNKNTSLVVLYQQLQSPDANVKAFIKSQGSSNLFHMVPCIPVAVYLLACLTHLWWHL